MFWYYGPLAVLAISFRVTKTTCLRMSGDALFKAIFWFCPMPSESEYINWGLEICFLNKIFG